MFDPHQKLTGTRYTTTAALAIAAAFFSPIVLVLSRPFGQASIMIATVFSTACLALAWLYWKKYSRLTIPSLERMPSKKK